MRQNGKIKGLVPIALAGVLVAASPALSGASAGHHKHAQQSSVNRLLAKYSGVPKFVAPGPAFNAKKIMKGKKVLDIPITDAVPLVAEVERSMSQAAKRIGFTFHVWKNSGGISQWEAGIQYAINQNYNVIDLVAINPSLIEPEIKKADQAGIKVIESHFAGFQYWKQPSYIYGSVRLPYYAVGEIEAAWAIKATDGKANALAIVADTLASTAAVVAGIKHEFDKNCSACTLNTVNSPTVTWTKQIPGLVTSAVQSDPNLNYLLPIYDAMTVAAASGLNAAHKLGKIGMATYNGTLSILPLVEKGEVSMDLGEDEPWIGLAMLDACMRAAGNLAIPKKDYAGAPFRILDKQDISVVGSPPNSGRGYGNTYLKDFYKLWRLTR